MGIKKIAGVRVPLLENVDFDIRPYSLFNSPKWYSDGIHLLKGLAQTAIEREFMLAKLNLLEHARKKTTQKVNLFEKVQIPGYQDALRKIETDSACWRLESRLWLGLGGCRGMVLRVLNRLGCWLLF